MSKSIAEMRQSQRVSLPKRTMHLCLAQGVVAEVQQLENERQELVIAAGREVVEGSPRRLLEAPMPPRVAEIVERLTALEDEMREHTGELGMTGKSAGEWLRWKARNPARYSVDDAGRRQVETIDQNASFGHCDAEALFDSLGDYATTWNGEPIAPDDWAFIISNAAPGDLTEMCREVVRMHEGSGATAPPKSPSGSSMTPPNATDSPSPATSESAPSDSLAGSPSSSTTTSTTQPAA